MRKPGRAGGEGDRVFFFLCVQNNEWGMLKGVLPEAVIHRCVCNNGKIGERLNNKVGKNWKFFLFRVEIITCARRGM